MLKLKWMLMVLTMVVGYANNGFIDAIPNPVLKTKIMQLTKDCIIRNTDIYTSCYSDELNRVVFSVYRVDYRAHRGNISTRPKFWNDRIAKQQLKWYQDSGYDRGHLAWDAAFDYDQDALNWTYNLELNIIPMKPNVNRFQWSHIESIAMRLAMKYELVVVDLLTASDETLKNTSLNIPKEMYKFIMYGDTTRCFKVDNFNSKINVKPYDVKCKDILK